MKNQISAALFSGIALVLLGCSNEPRTYPTKGKVVFKEDGKPFSGLIYFEEVKPPHTRSMAYIQNDGTFVLSTVREGSGSVAGEQVVRVDMDIPDGPGFANKGRVVHPKYLEFSTSPLRVTVDPGKENNFTIEIEKPGK